MNAKTRQHIYFHQSRNVAKQPVSATSLKPVWYNGRVNAQHLLSKLPGFLMGGYDPFHHKTPDDLRRMVQYQIDFYEEGEDSDIQNKRQYQTAKRWLAKLTDDER